MARYSPTQVPTTDISNTQRWLREETEAIRSSTDDIYSLARFVVESYTIAGYGGIGLDAQTPLSDIGAAWQVVPFDSLQVDEPRGITYDLASDAMVLNTAGVWRINAQVLLNFAELNQGRRLRLSMYNINEGNLTGPVFSYSVGRNTDGVNAVFSALFEITEITAGDALQLLVSSADDSFTGASVAGATFDANNVAEYRGNYFDELGAKARALRDLGRMGRSG